MQKGSVNKVILVGHLGSDPESRYMPNGNAVAKFSVATNESWRNSEGEIEERTEWHRCVLFGKLAERAGEFLKKGQMVYVEGRLQTRNWEDKDGVKRYTTEVLGDMFTMLGKREPGSGEPAAAEAVPATSEDDDLPF